MALSGKIEAVMCIREPAAGCIAGLHLLCCCTIIYYYYILFGHQCLAEVVKSWPPGAESNPDRHVGLRISLHGSGLAEETSFSVLRVRGSFFVDGTRYVGLLKNLISYYCFSVRIDRQLGKWVSRSKYSRRGWWSSAQAFGSLTALRKVFGPLSSTLARGQNFLRRSFVDLCVCVLKNPTDLWISLLRLFFSPSSPWC